MKITLRDLLDAEREKALLDEGINANVVLDAIEKLSPAQLRALIVKLANENPSMVNTIKNLARS